MPPSSEARAVVARDRRRVVQDRSAPRRQALPEELAGHRPSRGRAPSRPRPACPSTCTRPRCTSASRSATDVAFVFAGKHAAPGGLPVGASGRALLLLSGGIDSPVAGWLAAKRGLALDAVYFHSPPFIGEKARDKVLALGKHPRALAGAALGDGGAVHGCAEASARRRSGRAGGGAVPAHDDAHRRRDRRQAGGERAGHGREPGSGRQPDHRESDRHRGGGAAGGAPAAGHLRQGRDDGPRAPHRHLRDVDPPLRGLLLAVRPAHPATRARAQDAEKAVDSWTSRA